MKTNKSKGFTIIELIVVIAIIAILAAIVLVNVTQYINKAKDGAMEEELHTVQTGVISDNTTSSGLAFTAHANTAGSAATPCAGTTSASAWTAVTTYQSTATCGASTTAFCACAPSSNAAVWWCIDLTGVLKSEFATCLTGTTCNTGTFVCP